MSASIQIAAGVRWIVERGGVTIFGNAPCLPISIFYPYAGLWALIAEGTYSMERAGGLMAALMASTRPEAEIEVRQTIRAWSDAGLLEQE